MTHWTVILVHNYIICGLGRTRVGKKTVETDRRSHQVNKSISVKRTSWQLNKVTLVIALTLKPSLGGTKIFIAAYKNNDTHVTVTPEKDYLPPKQAYVLQPQKRQKWRDPFLLGRNYYFPWVAWNWVINLRFVLPQKAGERKFFTQFHATHDK